MILMCVLEIMTVIYYLRHNSSDPALSLFIIILIIISSVFGYFSLFVLFVGIASVVHFPTQTHPNEPSNNASTDNLTCHANSPYLLSATISFLQDPDQPAWHGYMYAFLMMAAATLQTIIQHQVSASTF